ncbi:MAG: hypothetical protein H8F28_12785 [Fibrella sp.]|nr:hypothetical protein [Armatimonadota bacterium]
MTTIEDDLVPLAESQDESDDSRQIVRNQQKLRRREIENQLIRVKQSWSKDRDQLMIRNKYGRKYVPTNVQAVIIGTMFVFFALLWLIISPAFYPVSLFMMILGSIIVWGIARKAQNYFVAEATYRAEIDRLSKELQQVDYQSGR